MRIMLAAFLCLFVLAMPAAACDYGVQQFATYGYAAPQVQLFTAPPAFQFFSAPAYFAPTVPLQVQIGSYGYTSPALVTPGVQVVSPLSIRFRGSRSRIIIR